MIRRWHQEWVDCDIGKRTCSFTLDDVSWVDANDSLDLLGEQFELAWCDQKVGCDARWEHHFRVLFPFDRSRLVTRVKWVESTLLEDRLDALLNFAALLPSVMRRGAQVLDHVSVEHTHNDIVNAEHLRVSDQDRFETWREHCLFVGRLRQRIDVMDFTSGRHDDELGLDFDRR